MIAMKQFTVCRKGYDPTEVDAYLRELETTLNNQAAQLAAFKEKEAAINKSVIDAQLLAADIHNKALNEAAELHQNALSEMEDLKNQVRSLHSKLTSFQAEYTRILQQYLVSLRCEDMTALFDNLDAFMQKLDLDAEAQEEPAVELADLGMGE